MLLVTGPTGNVGADLTRQLVDMGSDAPPYRLAGHHPDRLRAEYGDDVEVVPFAYDDRDTWPAALEGVDTLFLLFPLPKPKTARSWMAPFVAAAAEAGVRHVIYVTVPGADKRKVVPHHHVEQAILASGMHHTFLRCGYFSQNLVRVISTHGVDIAEHDEVFVPAKDSTTTFLDSRDVAAAVITIVAEPEPHRGASYVLTGPEALTFGEVAEVLSDVLERPITYVSPSIPSYVRRLRKRGVTWDTVLFMNVVYRLARSGVNAWSSEDLPKLLGRPATPFREFAVDHRWRWDQQVWT
ncbi:MAG: NmrA family NAD(P)-binding protein [Ilumatobacter sp.]|uniref:NmrA family NAD(P)-binding protein n=1 Tax=Ilumatobacter sp. TaxID=1967498 RepID=UPI003919CCC5